jgi:hypothetical protein
MHGYMNEYNMKTIFMKSLTILVYDGYIVYFNHNINVEGCRCMFNNLFFDVWCVIEFKHLLMDLHFIYNPYQVLGLDIDGIWVLPIH